LKAAQPLEIPKPRPTCFKKGLFMKKFLLLSFLMLVNTAPAGAATETKTATFAGGCFWCMESEFEDKAGVTNVVSGYAGPKSEIAPTYEQVSTGKSDYVEAVMVTYDPAKVSYDALLDIFWSNVDPFDAAGQFCDKGSQYIAAIYYGSLDEKTAAQKSLNAIEQKFGRKVATKIEPAAAFYEAEEYHQDYSKKNKINYKLYKNGCGRDDRLKDLAEEHKG
jgi:peptide-methionine (S)-S-oxide reductase